MINNSSSIIIDTLLNVFLAIAVDNLANAQELTKAEEAAAKAEQEVTRISFLVTLKATNTTIFLKKREMFEGGEGVEGEDRLSPSGEKMDGIG